MSFHIPENVAKDSIIIDPAYENLPDKSHPRVDWSQSEILDMSVHVASVLKRTQDWLDGKWQQVAGLIQEPKSSQKNEQESTKASGASVSSGKPFVRSSSENYQSGGDGDRPEETVKLKSICEQDIVLSPTPKKRTNQEKLVSTYS